MADVPFSFHDEAAAVRRSDSALPPWKILIVDDEPDVHSLTKLLLRSFRYRDRPLAFLSAYSAAGAKAELAEHDDIALVLLDVVMETEDAGLELVDWIRDELGNRAIQVVIRTGQPGQAPPLNVVSSRAINDYKEKTELTQQGMLLTVVKALRLYEETLPAFAAQARYADLADRARGGADDHELARLIRQDAGALAGDHMPRGAEQADPRLASLTEREREVLKWLSLGDSNKAIGLRLGVQEVTVKAHLRQIFSKLQVINRTQAASLALRLLEQDRP